MVTAGKRVTVGLSLVVAVCAILSAVAACTAASKYDETKEALNKGDQQKLDEFRAELEIGRNMAGRLLQFYGTQRDETLLGYVNQVGAYVGGYSEFPERRYMFEILDSDIVNAFACPGGYILITSGAIRHAQTEAELAGVLAHEVAHVGKKHMLDKLRGMSKDELEKASELAAKKLELPETVLVRERPKPEDNVLGDVLAKYLSGGAGGLNIVKAAGAGMAVMLEQGLGAEKEYEADAHGVRYAVAAGYDPGALNQYICRLKKKNAKGKCLLETGGKNGPKDAKTILDRTHPPVADRIANINKVLSELDADKIYGAVGKKRFAKYKSRIPDSKKDG